MREQLSDVIVESEHLMTGRIRQLPPDVIAKIAAGEVIERPASVVKELLENSVDAGATRIDIDLEAGGTDLIRVVDDGRGIAEDDLALAFSSHATSKLADADDLFRIVTLGFRGEALASIGGVSKVTLQSLPREASAGAEIRCEGLALSPVRPWNGSPGTRIEVRHLFYNVPVRKKFLKTIGTELGHVCEMVTKLALAHPALHITLRHNGKLVHDIPAAAGLLDRIGLFFGRGVRDGLYDIASPPGHLGLNGYVGDPKNDRGNARYQYFFVNGRPFRDRSLAHAFQEAYRGLLMTGRYPVGFLFLTIPPDQVDVNVHPTKSEVRFRDNSTIYSLVRSTVKNRLLKENLIPQLQAPPTNHDLPTFRRDTPMLSREAESPERSVPPVLNVPPRPPIEPSVPSTWQDVFPSRSLAPTPYLPFNEAAGETTIAPALPAFGSDASAPRLTDATLPPSFPLPFTPNGSALQVHDAYLILETPQGMLVIDQHALHERILFEQLRTRVRSGQLEVQRLLIPEPIELPAEQAALVIEVADSLHDLGLEVSEFGGNTILLSSYPTLLGRKAPHVIFQAVVDELLKHDRPPTKEAMLHHLMATMACKAAVKAGDRLSAEEITYLLELRDMAEDSHHCPHGRPTSLLFSRHELDKQFKRLG